jgi:hypothetical protein
MGLLKKINLVRSASKAEKIFEELFFDKTFLDIDYTSPSDYVAKYWNAYKSIGSSSNAMNGNIFELIIYTLFVRENLLPMYLQAKVAFIPNVEYDLIIYNKEVGPIGISLKTSLRERKKQADLEAIALKYVHRKSECYLISMDKQEVDAAKRDIKEGYLLGLNNVIYACSNEFDDFIANLKERSFVESGTVEVITSNQIVTSDLVSQYGNNGK